MVNLEGIIPTFSVRPANISDCPALGRILVSAEEDTFRGLVPDKSLEWTPEQSAQNWKRSFRDDGQLKEGEYIIVAETKKDGVVGFAMLGETRPTDTVSQPIDRKYTHELITIQVAPEWQGKGIGRLLVSHVAVEAQAQGATSLLVRVLRENPNRAFYERLEAVQLATEPYNWDGFETKLLVYGWENIARISTTQ